MSDYEHRLAFFGTYKDTTAYSRNAILRRAMETAGFTVDEYRPNVGSRNSPSPSSKHNAFHGITGAFKSIMHLLLQWCSLARHTLNLRKHKYFVVPYPSHADLYLLKLLTIGKPKIIVADYFLGLYDTIINDRKLIKRKSLIAKLIYQWEKHALQSANFGLMDTELHCRRITKQYRLHPNHLYPIPVGIDESIWKPLEPVQDLNVIRVLFWGTFIPLHGINTIIDAAKILEAKNDIRIELVGTGQTAKTIQQQLNAHWPKNLTWLNDFVQHDTLIAKARQSHILLGIFGTSDKAAGVIPYKVYQALALNRPVITRTSDAYPTKGIEGAVYAIEPGSPKALANKITELSKIMRQTPEHHTLPRNYYDHNLSFSVIANRVKALLSTPEFFGKFACGNKTNPNATREIQEKDDKNLPMVAIAMATYNGAQYLREQIASLQSQTHRRWQLFIGDDQSSDSTPELIKEFVKEDARIHVLPTSTSNQGHCQNFSRILKEVHDHNIEWVMLCDQDDVWLNHKIGRQLEEIAKRKKEYPALLHSDLYICDRELKIVQPSFSRYRGINTHRLDQDSLLHKHCLENSITGCTILTNLALLEIALPIPESVKNHDWWLAMVCLSIPHAHIEYLAEPLVGYRQHDNNTIGINSKRSRLMWPNWVFKALRKHKKQFQQQLLSLEELQTRLESRHMRNAIIDDFLAITRNERHALFKCWALYKHRFTPHTLRWWFLVYFALKR